MRWILLAGGLIACSSDITAKSINYSPEIDITDPIDVESAQEGGQLEFVALGGDSNDNGALLEAEWYLDEDVICPWASLDLDDQSTCTIVFGEKDARVAVSIRDPQGAGGADFRDISVVLRGIPTAEITAPDMGSFYYQNEAVPLRGIISDLEDLPEDLTAGWVSDIDGALSVEIVPDPTGYFQGASYLSEGEHALTLRVVDTEGRSSSDTRIFVVGAPNSPPTCAITEPQDGTGFLFGTLSNFVAEVDDIDIGPSAVISEWSSNNDGLLGSVSPDSSGRVLFSRPNLSRGTHTITMTAYDERGESCTDSLQILVGSAPSISLQSPVDGSEFLEGDIIDFAAQVSDIEQNPETLSLIWSSDVQGVLNTDPTNTVGSTSFAKVLDPGWHIVTLAVTDDVGLSHSESLSVLINQKPDTPSVTILPSNPKTGSTLSAVVSGVTDPDGQVPSVTYIWFQNGSATPYGGASISAMYTAKGETWRVEVQSSDGSLSSDTAYAETEIENSPPNIDSISINPSSGIHSESSVSCSASASDVDENVSASYIWSNQTTGATLATVSGVLLQNSTASPGDKLRCTAQTIDSDGFVDSAYTEIFVENRAPILGAVSVSPVTSTTSDMVTCSITAVDPDTQTLSYRYSWKLGLQVISTSETIVLSPNSVQPSDTLTCTATARDPYGAEVSASATTSVINSGLVFEGVDIYPPTGVNNEGRLTCLISAYDPDGSVVSKSYSWRNMSTGQSLGSSNPLQLDPTIAEVGDIIRCSGTVVDGSGFYTQNTTVNVTNTGPSIDSVTISPSSSVYTSSTLTCLASYTDLDNEVLTVLYEWMNVATGTTLGTGDTLTLTPYISSPSDAITCQAMVIDQGGAQGTGAESVLVENQVPTATWAEITPTLGYVSDVFEAYGYGVDPDNDAVSVLYSWYVNNVLYAVGTDQIGPGFPRGTKLVLEVTPTDGYEIGTPLNSNILVVRNSKPGPPQLLLAPAEPVETQDDVVCRISRGAYDADQDVVDYTFKWYRNGGQWSGAVDTTVYAGDTIPASEIGGWEEWRCEATPNDGYSNGTSVLSNIVEVRIICDPDLGPNLTVSGIDFHCIAESGFLMGSTSGEPGRDNDEDLHAVALNQDFFISVTEVTQGQFDTLMGYNPSQWLSCGADCPVEGVNWHMSAHFANTLSFLQGEEQCYTCSGSGDAVSCMVAIDPYECSGYRLPTEAEWEYAARADSAYSFWTPLGGGDLQLSLIDSCMNTSELSDGTLPTDLAWFCTNHPVDNDPRTSPVASLMANENGLYDMHGNVWEWCHDWYVASLGNDPVLNPYGPATGAEKIVRGGGWNSRPYELRSAGRRAFNDTYQAQSSGILGIRLARTYFGN
jgi:formylglycine-generating enzyme required for sulfatase activity